MDLQTVIYYAGFLAALALCRGLGPIFFYPMLADLVFDLCGHAGLYSGFDIRWLVAGYGFAMLMWVLVLSGALTKPTFVAVLFMDLGTILYRIMPQFQMNGDGQDFWNLASTGIHEVWLVSIFVVVGSMAFRSSVWAKINGRRIDLLTNPRKRFLLPIGAWAGTTVILGMLEPWIPEWLVNERFVIASQLLVWGWVVLEIPPYITHRRLMKQYSD